MRCGYRSQEVSVTSASRWTSGFTRRRGGQSLCGAPGVSSHAPRTPATGDEMASPAPVTAASSVLERLPVSRWHWRLVLLVGVGTFFDLYEVFLGGVLAPVLTKEWDLGTVGKSMVIAAGFAGMFIGANVLSIAADRLG